MKGMYLGVNTLFHVPGDVGGTETYLKEILQSLVAEYDDLRVTLFSHHDNDHTLRDWLGKESRVSFCRLPFKAKIRPLRILAEQTLLPFYVSKSGVELLWSPGYTAPYFSSCPQVVTIHDLQYKRFPQDLTWLERITLDRLVKIACRRCEGIITVSEFSRQEVLKYGFAPEHKVHAVLEGVSPFFSAVEDDRRIKEDVEKLFRAKQPFILCVAHTYPHKNVHLLIEAFNQLLESIPHNLVLVGKSRLGEPEVIEAISELKHPERLYRFQSGVSFELLRDLYQQADLFVLPSGYEGFGLPVLEAMMAGTPVLCSSEASLPEVGGEHVHYLDSLSVDNLARKMSVCLNMTAEERKDICQKAKYWAEIFTWQRSAQETMSVFESCLGGKHT